jgi:acetyl/propionyl-CoA carboxylase alpha subunit
MPSPGLVRAISVPGGPGIRDDRGVAAGFEVPVFYDSMISKLVVTGETRDDAIARLRRALDEYRVVGVKTTVPFFRWLIDQRAFLDGRCDTTYLDRVLADRRGQPFGEPTAADEDHAAIAAGLAAWFRAHRALAAQPAEAGGAWRRTARVDGLRGA